MGILEFVRFCWCVGMVVRGGKIGRLVALMLGRRVGRLGRVGEEWLRA